MSLLSNVRLQARQSSRLPVEVLGTADGDQAVAVGEHGEDANLVVVFELSTYFS